MLNDSCNMGDARVDIRALGERQPRTAYDELESLGEEIKQINLLHTT